MSTPAQRNRSSTNLPKKSSPTTPTNPTFAPRRARLNAKMELEPPSTSFMSVASFSLSNSSRTMPSISRSALASPATRQSRGRSVFINADSLDNTRDHTARTRVVRIQIFVKAEMVSEKLWKDDLEWRSQIIGQFRRHGGYRLVVQIAVRFVGRDPDDATQLLGPELGEQILLVAAAECVGRHHADHQCFRAKKTHRPVPQTEMRLGQHGNASRTHLKNLQRRFVRPPDQ